MLNKQKRIERNERRRSKKEKADRMQTVKTRIPRMRSRLMRTKRIESYSCRREDKETNRTPAVVMLRTIQKRIRQRKKEVHPRTYYR